MVRDIPFAATSAQTSTTTRFRAKAQNQQTNQPKTVLAIRLQLSKLSHFVCLCKMKVSSVALFLFSATNASAFAPSSGADQYFRVVLQAEPNDYGTYRESSGILNFQDKLGAYSRMSLSNVDTTQLTAIHPDRIPSRPGMSALPPADYESAPLPPTLTNFQNKLGPYSTMSLSNADTSELTAIHPDHLPPRAKVTQAPSADESAARPPSLTNFQNELGTYSSMSLSNVDTTELTAIHPSGKFLGNFRPEFNKEGATYLPPASEANVQSRSKVSVESA
jgi:hypothetical protein